MFRRKGTAPAAAPAVREDPKPVAAARPTPLDGVTLPPFSGEHPRCVKCNGTRADTMYVAEKVICDHWGTGTPGGRYTYGQERMHRTCGMCGWVWDEQCYKPKETDVRRNAEAVPVPAPPAVAG